MIGFLLWANTPLGWGAALPMNRAPERLVSIDLYYIQKSKKQGILSDYLSFHLLFVKPQSVFGCFSFFVKIFYISFL